MAFTMPCKWLSDQETIVLEMSSESSKSTSDAAPCTIRALLHELEETNIVDTGLHAHTCERPGPQEETKSGHAFAKLCHGFGFPPIIF